VLEVKCGRYDKGQAALSIMKEKSYDFILSAGDDNTDEDLFKILPEHAYSIKIGKSPSFARYNAIHYQSFLKLLEKIAG
ncbi:MAG TPA: bifunctional alpha,alpha-trehalose-phosphate synthase (UDP-forming)/trehalose-phosphatase, partial [Bacteroidales bacterium]|nr:bifunctional alpha,alpha-trehalose-phosphate synthase (UDP-forming)/trehalose-phosphatase [Bacteroidales bacterium]